MSFVEQAYVNFTGLPGGGYAGNDQPIPNAAALTNKASGHITVDPSNGIARIVRTVDPENSELTVPGSGRLEIEHLPYIVNFVNYVTDVGHTSASIQDARVTAKIDVSIPGRFANVQLKCKSGGAGNPTRGMAWVWAVQPTNAPGTVNLQWGISTQDTTDFPSFTPQEYILNNAPANGIIVEWSAVGINPTTFTLNVYAASATPGDDTKGALLYTWTQTAGQNGSQSDSETHYFANSGLEASIGSSNWGSNSFGTVTGPARFMSVKFETQVPGVEPLGVTVPTLVSQASGQNVLESGATGVAVGTLTITFKVENDLPTAPAPEVTFATMDAIVGDDTSDDGATHTFAAEVTSRHGVKMKGKTRAYVVQLEDDNGVLDSDHLIVEDYFAPEALPQLPPDVMAGRPVIITLRGDSRTSPDKFTELWEDAFADAGVPNFFVNNRGVASSRLCPTSGMHQGWRPDFDPSLSGGAPNLYTAAKNSHLALRAAHPGADEYDQMWIGVNDLPNTNLADHSASIDLIVSQTRADLGADVKLLWCDMGINTIIEADGAGLKGLNALREGILAKTSTFQGDANKAYFGCHQVSNVCRITPQAMADEVHIHEQHGYPPLVAAKFRTFRQVAFKRGSGSAPSVTAAPTVENILPGEDGTLTWEVEDGTWYHVEKETSPGVWTSQSGDGTPTPSLTITDAEVGDAGTYRLAAYNNSGTTYSEEFELTVGEGEPEPSDYDPDLERIAWTITAREERVSALSTQRHRFDVAAADGEDAVDPSDYDLQLAHITERSIEPDAIEWVDLAWEDDGVAYVLVGPDAEAALYLAPGAYFRLIRTKMRPHVVTLVPLLSVDPPAGL